MVEKPNSPDKSDRLLFLGIGFFIILLVTAFLALLCCPPELRPIFQQKLSDYKIHLGLDLKGGAELLYQIDPKDISSNQSLSYVVDETLSVLQKRIDECKTVTVKDPRIQKQGEELIIIQLPGLNQIETELIKKEIQTLGNLEFRLVASAKVNKKVGLTEATERKSYESAKASTDRRFKRYQEDLQKNGYKWFPARKSEENATGEDRLLWMNDGYDFTGRKFANFYVTQGEDFRDVIAFELKEDSKGAFGRFTKENTGELLAIVFNGVVVATPVIKTAIPGHGVLAGFEAKELNELLRVLNSGSLEVIPELMNESTIGPSLGEDAIRLGLVAGIIGLIAVILFMLVYYKGAGLIANFSLLLNVIVVGGVMVITGETLTLPGIAGLVLMMGMAVDANILIFERIREEKRKMREIFKRERGSDAENYTREDLLDILKNGFNQAFRTIFDSNITTLITAIVLYIFGSGPVKGFAFTMGIGILANFFTAITVSRILLELGIEFRLFRTISMLEWIKPTRIPFSKVMGRAAIASILVIVLGLGLFIYRGSQNYGLDLKGGIIAQLSLQTALPTEEVRSRLTQSFQQIEVQNIIADNDPDSKAWNDFSIRMPNRNDQEIDKIRQEIVGLNDQLRKKNESLAEANRKETQMQNKIDDAEVELRKLRSSNATQQELDEQKGKISDLEKQKAAYHKQIETLAGEEQKLREKRNELVDTKNKLAGVEELRQIVQEKFEAELSPMPFGKVEVGQGQFRIYRTLAINMRTTLPAKFIKDTLQNPAYHRYGFFKDVTVATPEFSILVKKPAEDQGDLAELFRTRLLMASGLDGETLQNVQIKVDKSSNSNFDAALTVTFKTPVPSFAIQDAANICGWTSFEISQLDQGKEDLKTCQLYFQVPTEHSNKADQEIQTMAEEEIRTAIASVKYNGQTIYLSDPFPRFTQISGMVAREQKAKAFQAIILSLVAILLYIKLRFPNGWVFGMGSILALAHDVAITVAVMVFCTMTGILRLEIDLTVIAALLTIVGYSINNTIVIFDRIREFQHRYDPEEWARLSFADITEQFNAAIGQTLARTMLTSFTTMISILAIFILNVGQGNSMEGFSFAMLIGLLVGTYSSILLATGYVLWRERKHRA